MMRGLVRTLLLLGWGVGVGVLGHEHEGEMGDGEGQLPLHTLEYIQDPVEELERKWSFEVCDS
jgi:hypothetical protein